MEASTALPMDLEWLKRMDVHLSAAQEETQRVRGENAIIDTEFQPLSTVLLTMREEMDCAFVAYDPDSKPDGQERPAA